MQPTTVVTLGNASMEPSSFEEAFGEYSEARGGRRAARQERKLERIAAKQEVRAAKQAARAEKKVGRQEVKAAKQEAKVARKAAQQQARIAKRAAAQAARQEKRAAAVEARGTRKATRQELKARRKGVMAGPEAEMDDSTMLETGDAYTPTEPAYTPETAGYGEEAGYAPEETGYAPEEAGYASEDTGYAPEGGGYEESGYEEEVVETPSGVYEEDNDDEYGAPEGPEDDYGFDGVMGAEDRFSELNDDSKEVKVSPMVADITKKIEWNKELISRLLVKRAELQGSNGNPNDVNKQIAIRKQRILDLESELQKYASFEGEYSLDGDFSEARGRRTRRRPNRAMIARRKREIEMGRKRAYGLRRKRKMPATPVARGLNPEFAPQRIVIPARRSSAEGETGLNGLDLQNDYDAPDTRTIELSSNAEGSAKKINWLGIGIGAVVAVGAIWALKKYKVV